MRYAWASLLGEDRGTEARRIKKFNVKGFNKMSYNLCKNCVYKNGQVYFMTKCNNDTEPYAKYNMDLTAFLEGYTDGWLQIHVKPSTKFMKVLDQVNKLWYQPEYDFDMDGGKVTKYIIYYKSKTVEKTPEQYKQWRAAWLRTYENLIKERL